MKGLLEDCRHAIRLYIRTPTPSLIVLAVLSVSMAFVCAFLSLYVDLVLRPHPGFEQSSQIATIGQNAEADLIPLSYSIFERISAETTTIDAAATYFSASMLLGPEQENARWLMVSEQFFSGLRPRLALGRGFGAEDHEPDAEPVVVLSYRYWQQRFGGDRNVLGTQIQISRPAPTAFESAAQDEEAGQQPTEFRIIGVMDEALRGLPALGGSFMEPPVWAPIGSVWPQFYGEPETLSRRSGLGLYVRRAPGASVTAVANEIRERFADLDSERNSFRAAQLDAMEGIVGNFTLQKAAQRQLQLFLAGSVLLALVAAVNVSLFLLARAPGRRRELGIRLSVGAPMKRLARQLATEAGLLVIVSAVLGLLGSVWLTVSMQGLALLRDAQWTDVRLLDWRVLGLSAAIVLLLTVLVSLAPIAGLKRMGIAAASRQVMASATLTQRLAGTTQVAVAGLLAGAAIASAWYLATLIFGYPGYETANRYSMISNAQVFTSDASIVTEVGHWRETIDAIPGVNGVAFGSPVPGTEGLTLTYPVEALSGSASEVEAYFGNLEQPFIDLLGLQLIRGRAPVYGEANVAVVNQTLARALWGREDVVGERVTAFRLGSSGAQVIGVLKDLSFGHPLAPVKPYIFSGPEYLNTVIESDLTAAALQQALDRIDSTVYEFRTFGIRPLETIRSELIAPDRARSLLTIATATLVVLLAAFGFYGIQRYLVSAGRREYAIRASLGAGPRRLGGLVLARAVFLGVPGLVLGAMLAFIVVAWLRGDYVSSEVSPTMVMLAVVAGLTCLVLAASFGPSRQARHTQPASLLRED